jgi:aspartate 1-decarboxylase
MQRIMLKAKLHRLRVTHVEPDYEGSCALDEALLVAADMREFEQIEIYNVTNGERFTTYAMRAVRDSGIVSVNGAAAHKARCGDVIIVVTYAMCSELELAKYEPALIYVDADNRPVNSRRSMPLQAH